MYNFLNSKINLFLFTTCLIFLITCVGDGVGLDEFGNPIAPEGSTDSTGNGDNGSTGLRATLSSIQTNIFDQICAVKCHKSPRPKKNLNLETGKAYDNLVDIPSKEIPAMMRVLPEDSENSYIIWKLEGRDGINGKQMPLNQTPLEDNQIQVIRDWIDAGALP